MHLPLQGVGASSTPAAATLDWVVGLSLHCAARLIYKVALNIHIPLLQEENFFPEHRLPPSKQGQRLTSSPTANDLISTDHGSNNIPHCKRAICRNISLQTWGIASFQYAHAPASQLCPLRNMFPPHSSKLNVAERHVQVSAFQLGAEACREHH